MHHGCKLGLILNYLLQKIPHFVGGVLLHLGGYMGIGVQGESGAVVAENAGQGFHIYAIL